MEKKLFFSVLIIKLLIVFLVAVFIGSAGFLWSGDGSEYIDLGKNFISGNGFARTAPDGTLMPARDRMPLYPLIVASLMKPFGYAAALPVAVFQAFLAAGIALLTYRIARFFLPNGLALLPAVLISFEPVISALHLFVFAETLLVFFILLFTYYFLKYLSDKSLKFILIASAALSLAVYTKPIALYLLLVPVGILLIYIRQYRFKPLVVLMGTSVLILSPWAIRNAILFDSPALTTYGPQALCGYQGAAVLSVAKKFPDASPGIALYTVLTMPEYRKIYDECYKSPSVFSTLWQWFRMYPYAFVKANVFVAAAFLTNDGMSSVLQTESSDLVPHHNYLTPTVFLGTEWRTHIRGALSELSWLQLLLILAAKMFWVLVLIFAIVGSVFLLRDKNMHIYALAVLGVTLYFTASSVLAGGIGAGARFRYHIDALLFVLAAVGARGALKRPGCQRSLDDPATTLEHARLIRQKPFLRNIYMDFYNQCKEGIASIKTPRTVVELGSGGGFIKEVIPDVITSDIQNIPTVEKHFSVLAMPFEEKSVDAFLMINVLHHIPDPAAFLREMDRRLKPGGRVVMIEPATTWWSSFIYTNFHHESFDPNGTWGFKPGGPLSAANGALPWIIFYRDRKKFEQQFPSLKITALRPHTPFRYILSGGVSMPQLLPSFLYPVVVWIEKLLLPFNNKLGMFYTIEIKKQ